MNSCQLCQLNYNDSDRYPMNMNCGHTLCKKCLDNVDKCFQCNTAINKNSVNKNIALTKNLPKGSNQKSIDKVITVCFGGECNAGKTSLVLRLSGKYEQVVPTLGAELTNIQKQIQNFNVRYSLWDTSGQERFKALTSNYFRKCDVYILVYDLTKKAQQNKVGEWIQRYCEYCSKEKTKILVVGNKLDLEDKSKDPIGHQNSRQLFNLNAPHVQLSCLTGKGIDKFWQEMTKITTYFLDREKEKKQSAVKNLIIENVVVTQKETGSKCC